MTLDLRTYSLGGKNQRALQYVAVGLVGVGVNEGILYLSVAFFGLSYVIGGVLSRVVSILTNYALNDYWTWSERGVSGVRGYSRRAVKYVATRLVGIAIGLAVLIALVEGVGMHYLVANLVAIGAGFLWGFGTSEHWVWRASETNGRGSSRRFEYTRLRSGLTASIQRARENRYTVFVFVLALAMFIGFSYLGIRQHLAFRTGGADLGSYVHMFSSTLSGDGWLPHGKYRPEHPQGSYWGAHFSLTLLAFIPVFALFPSPSTLLVLKSFALAASIPILWFAAKTAIESRPVALAVVVSYALNPFLWSAWLFDFQEQVLVPALVFASYYWYVNRRHGAFLVAIALVVLTNEFFVYIVAGYIVGLSLISVRTGELGDRWRVHVGALLVVLGGYLLSSLVLSYFSTAGGIPLASTADPIHQHTDQLRLSFGELLGIFLTNPELFVESLFHNRSEKALYFVLLLAPLLFIPLFDESSMLAVAPFLAFAWLFAGRAVYWEFAAHYPLYLLPFLYIGMTRGLAVVEPVHESSISGYHLLAAVLFVTLLVGAIAGPSIAIADTDERTERLNEAIQGIPTNDSLVTQNDVYPHVATRSDARFVVRWDLVHEYQRQHGSIDPEYVLIDTNRPGLADPVQRAFGERLLEEYGVYKYESGTCVFKRGYDGEPTGITRESDTGLTYDPGTLTIERGERIDGTLTDESADTGTVWYGPYETLPAGAYEATYHVNVTGVDQGFILDVTADRGSQTLAREKVGATDGWQEITIGFELDDEYEDVEFRGIRADQNASVVLESITVETIRVNASHQCTIEVNR